jgi:two-component system nitrogen regulation response regulator GlnG
VQIVGGPARRVDVRILAATDADLERACAEGSFRAPLYHRLAHAVVAVPPLRTRPVDVAVQVAEFVREELRKRGRAWPADGDAPWLGRAAMEALMDAPWPGNTRELRATVGRMVERDLDRAMCEVERLTPRHPAAPAADPTPSAADPTPDIDTPDADIPTALAKAGYRLSVAAEILGISRNTLKKRMDAENIRRPVDIGADEIAATVAREGSVRGAARALGVSEHGLRLRMGELAIA